MRTLSSIVGIVVAQNPNQGLQDLKNAGFSAIYIDLSMLCPGVALESLGKSDFKSDFATRVAEDPTRLAECAAPLFEKANALGLDIPLVKAPDLSSDTKRTDLNDTIKTLAQESILLCGKYGVTKCIIPPLFAGIDRKDLWTTNREYYLSLASIAKEQHVTILLENNCRNNHGHYIRGICSDKDEARQWLSDLNREVGKEDREMKEEIFGLAFNVGNANLCSLNMNEYLTTVGKSVKAVLISDNNGVDQASLLPFTSTGEKGLHTDWLSLVRGVRAIDFDGDTVLKYDHTAAAASPLLKPGLLSYAKQAGDEFAWQFGMERMVRESRKRVLFGAGNMCRNYMKNYGEAYPPLFTCDNNPANWGKTFEGLEIKNPEELKNLPEDVSIFICNIYYRQIEEQLKEMGLKNPICYFNDEYMPSFHFERLEMATAPKN